MEGRGCVLPFSPLGFFFWVYVTEVVMDIVAGVVTYHDQLFRIPQLLLLWLQVLRDWFPSESRSYRGDRVSEIFALSFCILDMILSYVL